MKKSKKILFSSLAVVGGISIGVPLIVNAAKINKNTNGNNFETNSFKSSELNYSVFSGINSLEMLNQLCDPNNSSTIINGLTQCGFLNQN